MPSPQLFRWLPKDKDTRGIHLLGPYLKASLHSPSCNEECEKAGGQGTGDTARQRRREAAFVIAETTVFVPQHCGGTRATNVKQTKARGTSFALNTHIHTIRLPSEETQRGFKGGNDRNWAPARAAGGWKSE